MDAGTSGPPPSFGLAGRARVRSGGSPGAETTPAARLGPPGPWVAASPRRWGGGCEGPDIIYALLGKGKKRKRSGR